MPGKGEMEPTVSGKQEIIVVRTEISEKYKADLQNSQTGFFEKNYYI